jgi:hypothetical protein
MNVVSQPVQIESWRSALEVSAYIAVVAGFLGSILALVQGMTNIQIARSVELRAEVVRIYAREEASGRAQPGVSGSIRHYVDIRYLDPNGAPASADGLRINTMLAKELKELPLATGRKPTIRIAYAPEGGNLLERLVRRMRGPVMPLEPSFWNVRLERWQHALSIAGPLLLFGGIGYIFLHNRRVARLRELQKARPNASATAS